MKVIVVSFLFFLITSCSFQHINFNSEEAKEKGVKAGNEYFQKLKDKGDISSYKMVSVEDAMLYVGEKKDTIKEVYKLIYRVGVNGISKNELIKIKKTKNKFDVKSKKIN